MDYEVSTLWRFKVIGFERTFAYETANRDIPAFWDEICEKYCNHTIYAGKAPSCPQEQAIMDNCIGEYGVIIDDVGEGHFRYLIAGKYTGGDVPEGMSTYTFPKGEWAIFQSVGAVPEALQALNARVFKEWLPGNPDYELGGAYCVEYYDCTGEKTDADYRSSLWIPVRAYQAEAEKRWGETAAFKESAARTGKRSREENDAVHAGLMAVFERFGAIRDVSPSDERVRTLVAELQNYISRHYYTCTDEMLKNLGLMYSADERFKANIDRKGGEGTAAFISEAIKVYFE